MISRIKNLEGEILFKSGNKKNVVFSIDFLREVVVTTRQHSTSNYMLPGRMDLSGTIKSNISISEEERNEIFEIYGIGDYMENHIKVKIKNAYFISNNVFRCDTPEEDFEIENA